MEITPNWSLNSPKLSISKADDPKAYRKETDPEAAGINMSCDN